MRAGRIKLWAGSDAAYTRILQVVKSIATNGITTNVINMHHAINHSFAFKARLPAKPATPSLCCFIWIHSRRTATNPSMTFLSIPALKHIRTRSSPGGTVGGTTGLTMKPLSRNSLDSACGSGVINPKIGDGGSDGRSLFPDGNGGPKVFGSRRTNGEVDASNGSSRPCK